MSEPTVPTTQRQLESPFPDVTTTAAADTEPDFDQALLSVLATIVSGDDPAGRLAWETVGSKIIQLGRREARRWQECAGEYEGAFIGAAIEFIRNQADVIQNAERPWGLIVSRARLAGLTAVGAELSGGLTARDPRTHRVRYSTLPRVVSFDVLYAQAELAMAG